MKNIIKTKTVLATGILILANFAMAGTASAHCDGLDGPVIIEARSAIEKKDVTPLLKWVPAEGEGAVKDAFARTLQERTHGKAAQAAADRRLFETLVRIHRESEGAPFTGIKPAGQIAPVVIEADAALDKKTSTIWPSTSLRSWSNRSVTNSRRLHMARNTPTSLSTRGVSSSATTSSTSILWKN